MPHKKGKKKSKKPKTYRKCESRVAPNCTGLYNPATTKKDGICNRCYQNLISGERRD